MQANQVDSHRIKAASQLRNLRTSQNHVHAGRIAIGSLVQAEKLASSRAVAVQDGLRKLSRVSRAQQRSGSEFLEDGSANPKRLFFIAKKF
jgi:hypothetical protein